jgi:predicted dehydrogenase
MCLDAGCHAYIEKPFTVNGEEADRLIGFAEQKGLKLTVGTDEQFTCAAIEMRQLVHDGYLGGQPVHMEAYYCYELGDERYARAFLDNNTHWLRSLPGQLMHNIISHGIAKIAEFLKGDDVRVISNGHTSALLLQLGEKKLIDELRAIIIDESNTTAYFTFSTQMKPSLREFRIYGPQNGLLLNQSQHSLIKLPGKNYKSYGEKFIPLHYFAKQYKRNMATNAKLFLKNNFHMKAGLRQLIELFYKSMSDNSPPPIPYREILLTTRIMDSIFSQVRP